ncbi:WD40 repeat-like protein [Leucogyrophana mollusca]|uniref:WD40 repeat-like protein n=1 Tax=Leucogyrophana mollusca TaxID=85980 RepID=A0ACB8B1L3_9AGAM|nr:WD40 repeat-like protein [Leucogyrophana mollusca]
MLTACIEGIKGGRKQLRPAPHHPPSASPRTPSLTPYPSLSSPRAMLTSSNPIKASGMRRALCRPTKVFKGHTKSVNSVVYFPDGRCIASGSSDKTVIIWDVESGRQDGQPLHHDSSVRWIAISPNGRRIASGMHKGVVIWDVLTREMVHEIKGDGVWMLTYSPDGHWIAIAPTADERVVQLWDADTGKPGRDPLRCDGDVYSMVFSPDVSRIAIGFRDGSFEVIDIATGESVVGPIKCHKTMVNSVVYSADGRFLITGSRDKSIRVWDSKTGVEFGKPMLGHKDEVNCLSISADGRRIASGGDSDDETVRVWDLETRLQVGDSFDAHGWVPSVALSPNGRCIISGGKLGTVCLWDTESFETQGPHPNSTCRHFLRVCVLLPANVPCLHQASIRQQRKACGKPKNVISSINSSLLDLPAVVQQPPAIRRLQETKLSDDDDWDTESIRPHFRDPQLEREISPLRPAKPGPKWSHNIRERLRPCESRVPTDIPDGPSHPPPDDQPIVTVSPELPTDPQTGVTSIAQPSVPGHPWSRAIRDCWRRIRARTSRVPADLQNSPVHLPLALHERPNTPISPELPTDREARQEWAADTQNNTQDPHPRTRSSRKQKEANVALGKLDERLYAAPPRDINERRRWRARERRRAARNDDSDSEPEDGDAESYYENTGCLDAFCFLECFRWWRHSHSR